MAPATATKQKSPDAPVWDEFIVQNPASKSIQDMRSASYDRFAAMGLPTPRSERYKYTDIPRAENKRYFPYTDAAITLSGDTRFATSLDVTNLPEWAAQMAQSIPPGEAQYKDMALWHAGNAWLRDGLVIDIPAKTQGTEALYIDYTGQADTSFVPRTLIRVAAGAEFTIIERHAGEGAYWNNQITQVHVEKGARLRHYRVQDNSDTAIYTQNTHVTIERDAGYEAFVMTTGSQLSRNQIHVELQGENGEVRLGGVNLLSGTQHGDTTITIDHQAPHCHSNQNYKTILDDKAHGVFQGKVHVFQIAQKTDGYQLANTLLLSPTAQMDTKPELEIYADDVRCSHGATTGQIDTAPLFYLRTRGLSEAEARLLLMQAFLGPALDDIRDEKAAEMFNTLAFQWLQNRLKK